LGYHGGMSIPHRLVAGLAGISLLLASCGGGEPAADAAGAAGTTAAAPAGETAGGSTEISGISTVSVDAAAAIAADPPADLVLLDVRTPEEFAEGHLEGAVLIDFYDADFADQLAALDRDVPYLVYCRSGNRSGQAMSVMEDLGFTSAVDVDGGIVAWSAAGLPVTGG
jgi:phage shock protein E